MKKSDFRIEEFATGALCLSCGDSMDEDLIFASGAMKGDPDLDEQRKILEFILVAINAYELPVGDEVVCQHDRKTTPSWDYVRCDSCGWISPSGQRRGIHGGFFPSMDAVNAFDKFHTYPGMNTNKPVAI